MHASAPTLNIATGCTILSGRLSARTETRTVLANMSVVAPLWLDVPNWVSLTIVVASIALALLVIALMFVRVRPASDEDSRYPDRYLDPVLVISALTVIGLALAVWISR